MPASSDDLLALLGRLGIEVTTHSHAPAFTVEQGNQVWGGIPGIHCKNLFLKDAKARLWLVVAPAERRIDLKALPAVMGSARLSFGSSALLGEVLGIEPGSVTPFAVINDPAHRVTVVLDEWMMGRDIVNYHPLRNDMTTSLRPADLRRFLAHTGHLPVVVDLS
ncbi:MAG: prolyl-tRNA synthetase associated domain-containing protein [Magnetospirillum sp.]|nr:prolyl-tRNA synthetase associated domain-containing protein [Magnetospirillum sp.]